MLNTKVLILFATFLILVACQGISPIVDTRNTDSIFESPLQAAVVVPQSPLPTPDSIVNDDASILYGRLLSRYTGEPLVRAIVRLPQVICLIDEEKREGCIYGLNNAFSPSAITDEDGFFVFENVEPDDYALFVGDFMMSYDVVEDSEDDLVVFTVSPGELLDMGTHVMDLR